jgi:hypothetical protein
VATKRKATQRATRPDTWPEAIRLAEIAHKLWNDEPLTQSERRLAADALNAYTDDQSNDRYWRSVAHRRSDQERAFHAVLDIKLDVAREICCEGDAKKAAVKHWRMRIQRINEAMKLHGAECDQLIAHSLAKHGNLDGLVRMNEAQWERLADGK